MDKAKLTAEQAKAVEVAMERLSKESIISAHVRFSDKWDRHDHVTSLNGMPLDTLVRALYIGYEVEKTEDELLLEAFNRGIKHDDRPETRSAFRAGIKEALEILDISVSGINII